MSVRKTPEELLWDRLTELEPDVLRLPEAIKWSRSIMKYIKKPEIQRFQIEHCLGLLDELVFCMQKFVDHGDENCEEISESSKAAFFDILLNYSDIKEKYDKKEERRKQENKLTSRLKKLEEKLNAN